MPPNSDNLEHSFFMENMTRREPTLLQALIPVFFLVGMLASSVYLFGGDSSYGPNQIALILAAALAAAIGIRNGFRWKEIEQGIVKGISLSLNAALILLVVGSLIGTWILSGIVPSMIYYGLHLMNPSFFYPVAAVVCAIVALATGSSWTTASTIGIALIGIAGALGLNLGIAAGAIISGAYFGDKLSPLSDTTNLAPAMAGTDLITHIRHMLWTTIPSMIIALILYSILGFFYTPSGEVNELQPIFDALTGSFTIGWYLLIPPAVVIAMVVKRIPALPALLIGALLGGISAMIFQQSAVAAYVGNADLPHIVVLLKGFWMAMFQEYTASTGNEAMDALLSRGGMGSMLNTIWLILSAMTFGGVMEKTKLLERLADSILSLVSSTGSLITSTLLTSISTNILSADQYISIVLPGRMFRLEYQRRGLHPKNLSRALEDAGTLTSPMIPWNTCGAFMATALGVPTMVYMPFVFLGIINPLISAIYGFTGFTIEKLTEEELAEMQETK